MVKLALLQSMIKMNIINKFKIYNTKAKIQDIEANLKIIEKRNWIAKLNSFCCLGYPFISIDKHIEVLTKELNNEKIKLKELSA